MCGVILCQVTLLDPVRFPGAIKVFARSTLAGCTFSSQTQGELTAELADHCTGCGMSGGCVQWAGCCSSRSQTYGGLLLAGWAGTQERAQGAVGAGGKQSTLSGVLCQSVRSAAGISARDETTATSNIVLDCSVAHRMPDVRWCQRGCTLTPLATDVLRVGSSGGSCAGCTGARRTAACAARCIPACCHAPSIRPQGEGSPQECPALSRCCLPVHG